VFSFSANNREESVTPFQWTRGRLPAAAGTSLLVILAGQLLKWQDPVSAASGLLHFFALGVRKFFVNSQTPLSTP
jgi:hypothetical protein